MQTAVIARAILFVCLSVRPSVTFQCFRLSRRLKLRSCMRLSASDRNIILDAGEIMLSGFLQGITTSEGVISEAPPNARDSGTVCVKML